jgi:hypothetical protein
VGGVYVIHRGGERGNAALCVCIKDTYVVCKCVQKTVLETVLYGFCGFSICHSWKCCPVCIIGWDV